MSQFVKPHTIEGWEELCRQQTERMAELTTALESSTRAREEQRSEIGTLLHHFTMARAQARALVEHLQGARCPNAGWHSKPPTDMAPRCSWCERRAELLVPAADEPVSLGAQDIALERARQVQREGWNAAHDDAHDAGQLAAAAACYAYRAAQQADGSEEDGGHPRAPLAWPWDESWWKPRDARRNLVRAGGLIAAEIDRLDREVRRG